MEDRFYKWSMKLWGWFCLAVIWMVAAFALFLIGNVIYELIAFIIRTS